MGFHPPQALPPRRRQITVPAPNVRSLNARHELFAQAVAKGRTQTDAYGDAGYNPHRGNASKLAQRKIIQARVAEIQAEAHAVEARANELLAEQIAITKEKVLEQLGAIAFARASGEITVRDKLAALEKLGKYFGLFRERAELTGNLAVDVVDETDALETLRSRILSIRSRRANLAPPAAGDQPEGSDGADMGLALLGEAITKATAG
jgi:hypothetical protein